MSKKIKICSLFSGIGGFEKGVGDALGDEAQTVFASEINPFASKAYALLHGQKPHGDITVIDEKNVPDHDFLVAGFPCQPFSKSGRGLGFVDTRGTLFFDVARIAKEKKPKAMLLENVKGLIGHDKGHTFSVILKTISDLGYKIDFQTINSKHFGVPQNRERAYIICLKDAAESEWESAKKRKLKYPVAMCAFDFPKGLRSDKRLKDIMENKVEEKFYLEGEKALKIIEKSKKLKTDENRDAGLVFVGGLTDKPNWLDNGKELSRNYKQGSRVYSSEGLAATLSAQGVGGLGGHSGLYVTPDMRVRRLTALECFRLQSFPDSYFYKLKENGFSDAQMYKMAGNAVTSSVIREITKSMRLNKFI